MRIARTERKKARIEIIPMIDTIFFLLVFFMYTSLSMVKMNGLTISLPKPASGTVAAVSTPAGPNTLIATVTD
nr:biopolymer transporter ExbD [Armatimonadota bacterium]